MCTPTLGHYTLGIECKNLLSTRVDRMLVGNRVGIGLTRRPLTPLTLFNFSITGVKTDVLMVVCPLGWGLGNLGSTQDGRSF